MARRSSIAFLAAIVLSSLTGAAQSDKVGGKPSWPQFRGPNASGIGTGKPPVQFGPGEKVLWKTAVGPGLSSPIVWNGRIFVTEFDSTNKQLATLCIDQLTGKILWRRTVAPETIEKVHQISSPAGSTPVTDGERLFVYFGSYGLIAYDRDGNMLWEKRLPDPETLTARSLHRSSPATF
jgi:outer membrane protein assembly factor BamB